MRKHVIHWGRMLFTMTMVVTMCSFYRAQDNSRRSADKDNYAFLDRLDSEVTSQEEKIIKKAYDKLVFLANAHRKSLPEKRTAQLGRSANRMAFSVNIINSGGIEEISGRPFSELITLPSDERIDVYRSITAASENDKEGKASFSINWTDAPYIPMNDRGAWPLRDILTAMGPKYADVRKYTTYEVMVVLDGKSKNYLATALYHTPLQSSEEPRVEFWDAIAGAGGVLTSVFYEQLPPLEASSEKMSGTSSTCEACRREAIGPDQAPMQPSQDNRDHSGSGMHTATSTFARSCERYTDCRHTCFPSVFHSSCGDSGLTAGGFYHVCVKSELRDSPGTVPRSQTITCKIGIGYGFESCVVPTCGVSITVGWSGSGITVSGASLWSAGHSSQFQCEPY
jgi:hypothetical protein